MLHGTRRLCVSFAPLALASSLAACVGSSSSSPAMTPAEMTPTGGGGRGPAADGATGAGLAAAGDATLGGDNAPPVQSPHAPSPVDPPGVYLTSATQTATATGVSACGSTTLGAVLDQIRADDATLADITTIYDPATATSDGSFIYAYDVGVSGFDIVFKRGLGDCPAGCTENDYQYFSTGSACKPMKVGHYHATWGTGTCLTVDGAPMWTHPLPPDPLTVCGSDNSPHDLRGTYSVHASGQRTVCAVNAAASPVDAQVQFVVEQDSKDLSSGFVTFSATGDPLVDGVRLPARFQRQRFDAALMTNPTPGTCAVKAAITARYDLEGFQPGGIESLSNGDAACGGCKGSMSVVLTGSTNIR
jgi:hypothetical protein